MKRSAIEIKEMVKKNWKQVTSYCGDIKMLP